MTERPDTIPRIPEGAADCHAHVIKKDMPLSDNRHSQPARDASVDDYLQVLDTHGITYGLLTAPSFYGANNDVLLHALAQADGRLRGTAIVEPEISETELSNLQDNGVCGLRFNWIRRDTLPDIESRGYQRLLSKAKNLGLHIEIYLEGEFLPPVLKAVNKSGARAVVDHFGHPEGKDGIHSQGFHVLLDAIEAGNTWVKLSAPFRLRCSDPAALARKILAQSNGERAVWATDWPWVGHENDMVYADCIDWLFDWVPDKTARDRVLVENAHGLFGFGSTKT
ncbi:membrane protein [Advenella kashmirensis W13003]|uniref:Membrane protein n=1 Tax=Advenella kashmirensis W13003 TaxID=1424334 RepID=V8QQV1_9BURK|nr:amidohydrolase family protein [Advenella kashmirensis]ETF02007.1 membrane protein [Advenella kashmirensis W13003]